jgi:L-arabinose transport system ATP-binding protein
MDAKAHYLQFESVGKVFPGVKALDNISFGAREGSVHALLGENGAGKSTLLKILSGAHSPSGGTLRLNGEARVFASTHEAIAAGVAVIYQELHLVPELSVAENLFLGHLPQKFGLLRRGELYEQTRQQLARLGEDFHPVTKVGRLSIAQRQMVEIAKALARGANVIAFDEPTSSLSAREIEKLFAVIAELKARGCVILYVTHRMEEVFRICDSATIFRDGRHVKTFETMDGVTPDTIVSLMVGRDIQDVYNYHARPHGEPALELENVMGPGLAEPVSLTVAKGEIVGLFGLVGAGRTELLRLVFGATRMRGGSIKVWGKPVRITSPRDAIRAGVLLCPEDRKKEGIIPIRSVMENINLSARRNTARLGLFINGAWERENAAKLSAKLAVKTPSLRQLIVHLSGGNQQKVILARWLSEQVKVILLDEPTRGIDVGAKSEIYSIIYNLAKQGAGVLMVSSDLPEVLGVADRVLVMQQRRLTASLDRSEATQERTLRLALPPAA